MYSHRQSPCDQWNPVLPRNFSVPILSLSSEWGEFHNADVFSCPLYNLHTDIWLSDKLPLVKVGVELALQLSDTYYSPWSVNSRWINSARERLKGFLSFGLNWEATKRLIVSAGTGILAGTPKGAKRGYFFTETAIKRGNFGQKTPFSQNWLEWPSSKQGYLHI